MITIPSIHHSLANLNEDEKKTWFSVKAKFLTRAEQAERNIFGKNTYFSDYITYSK